MILLDPDTAESESWRGDQPVFYYSSLSPEVQAQLRGVLQKSQPNLEWDGWERLFAAIEADRAGGAR